MMNDTVKTTDENPAESAELKALRASCEQYIKHLERRIKRLSWDIPKDKELNTGALIAARMKKHAGTNAYVSLKRGSKPRTPNDNHPALHESFFKYNLMKDIQKLLEAKDEGSLRETIDDKRVENSQELSTGASLEEKKKISIRAILAHKPNKSSNKTNLEKLKDATGHPKRALVKRALAQLSCWCGVGLVYQALYRSPTFFGRVHGDVVAEKMKNYTSPKAGA